MGFAPCQNVVLGWAGPPQTSRAMSSACRSAGVRPAAQAWRHMGPGWLGSGPGALRFRSVIGCRCSAASVVEIGWDYCGVLVGGVLVFMAYRSPGVAHFGGEFAAARCSGVRGSSRLATMSPMLQLASKAKPPKHFVGGRADVDRLQVIMWHDCGVLSYAGEPLSLQDLNPRPGGRSALPSC